MTEPMSVEQPWYGKAAEAELDRLRAENASLRAQIDGTDRPRPCACKVLCADVPVEMDHTLAVCKGLKLR